MDNHPIPQDVTGFKFRLIGDMTVKQFGYLAAGVILGVIFIYAPFHIILRIPFIIVFPIIGLAFAFMPIQGRPADAMAGYFLNALIQPNQYAYHKVGGIIPAFNMQSRVQVLIPQQQKKDQDAISQSQLKRKQLQNYLQAMHQSNHVPMDQREKQYLANISGYINQMPAKPQIQAPVNIPTAQPNNPQENKLHAVVPQAEQRQKEQPKKSTEDNLNETEEILKTALEKAKVTEQNQPNPALQMSAHERVTEIEKQLESILAQKNALESELHGIKQNAAEQPIQPTTQTTTPTQAPNTPIAEVTQGTAQVSAHSNVRQLTEEQARQMGLPRLPDVPNLILGIIKDPRGNALSNILVEVRDKEGIPARAFRTNTLGQFASATPLTTGNYEVTFEDPKGSNRFDPIELVANGNILLPIEIVSRDEREDLRRELFNNG